MMEASVLSTCEESPTVAPGEVHGPTQRWLFVLQVAGMTLLLAAILVGYSRWRTGSMALVWPYLGGQRLLFDTTRLDLGILSPGAVIERELRVSNLSSRELRLLGSQKSCGCIALDDFPIAIPAGGDRRLRLKIGLPQEPGAFEHVVKFFSDEVGHSTVVVSVTGSAE